MKYRIKAAFLLGTEYNPAYEHLDKKQAIKAGNELRDSAMLQGWTVEGPFTAAPQILAAVRDGITRYMSIDQD